METPFCASKKKSLDVRAYIAIARPDHWFKNVFMLFGAMLAFFVDPDLFHTKWHLNVLIAIIATCLIASSNYVINEVLDAPTDRLHPTKCNRPIPSGRIFIPLAYIEWIILSIAGLGIAYCVNLPFFLSALVFNMSGISYNIPPLRTKDIPYIDVLSESINNPIRLFLGWFAVIPDQIPPLSIVIAYWMAGAFFMTAKRCAEYRLINDPKVASSYRSSFGHYDQDKLVMSEVFYATACSLFFGIFIIRYHLELILAAPFIAGFFSYYVGVSFKPNSKAQSPEKLYREYGFVSYACALLIVLLLLLFTRIPLLYEIFNVVPYRFNPLWTF
jgi:4-hydroxybenzoate polyprenyltransferase